MPNVSTRTENNVSHNYNYVMRQSGLDGNSHIFRAEGEFIPPVWVEVAELGVVEYRVPLCGHALPVAAIMTQGGGRPCLWCTKIAETPPHPKHTVDTHEILPRTGLAVT